MWMPGKSTPATAMATPNPIAKTREPREFSAVFVDQLTSEKPWQG